MCDDHYGGPRPYPARAVRAKTEAEKAFVALGPVAEEFIKGAAARGVTTLAGDLTELCNMEAAHGTDASVAAIGRAVRVPRFPQPVTCAPSWLRAPGFPVCADWATH